MKPDIENLKVCMSDRGATGYQRALGMREFKKLLDYVAELEQLHQANVSSSLVCKECQKKMIIEIMRDDEQAGMYDQ